VIDPEHYKIKTGHDPEYPVGDIKESKICDR